MMRLEINEQFPVGVQYNFSNAYTELADGKSYTVVSWEQPLAEFDVSKAIFDQELRDYILEFFDQVSDDTFLYLDPCDNFCTDEEYELKPDIFVVGELFPISATQFQLCKVYRAGGENSIRPITRPINDENFKINSISPHTVDFDTGLVSFPENPEGQPIKWQGSFLTPCRLIEEDLTYQVESNADEYSLPSLIFKEVRETDLSFNSHRGQSISAELELDLIVASQVITTKKISSVYADSGWYKSTQLWVNPITSYSTAPKSIADRDDIEAVIAIWRVTYGGAIAFKYEGKTVRVKDSTLAITAESYFVFGIASLNLVEAENSFLDNLDDETYLIPIVDSSGSMNSDIPLVEQAISELRAEVKNSVYRGSQEAIDKYFKPILYLGDERWVDWFSRDYRDNPMEPDKLVILAWINESSPVYHNTSSLSPTSRYLMDVSNFFASYSNRRVFAALVYAVRHAGASFIPFQNHLIAAHQGTNGYEAIKDYGVTIRPDIESNTPASFYFQDIVGGNLNNKAARCLCRCWSIERKNSVPEVEDFANQKIIPSVPAEISSSYLAYVYGTYLSTSQEGPYDKGCGDLGYWRSRIPVSGSSFIVNAGSRDNTYYVKGVNPNSGQASRATVMTLSQAEYESRITSELSQRNLRRGYGCNSVSHYGNGIEITEVIPLNSEIPDPPQQIAAYFKLGQCSGVDYGFKVKWANLESAVFGKVTGKITAVRVYLHKQGVATSNNPRIYALSVDNDQGATYEPILIQKSNSEYLTYDEAPAGIFSISAVRLDSEVDNCGNFRELYVTQQQPPSILGFTNHDSIVSFDGINYSPRYGGDAQAREHTEELSSSNNTETIFVFSSEAISIQDLLDGVYDGANFVEWLVEWDNPDSRIKLASGNLGRITTYRGKDGGLSFKVEMRSLMSRLQQKSYFITVKLCPKTYGKQGIGNCNHNTFAYSDYLEITEVVDSSSFRVNSTRSDNFYGKATFTTGNRAGIVKLVDSYDAATKIITLRNSIKGLAVGDRVTLLADCDHTLKTCSDRNNAHNFGGYWHVPGADKTRVVDP